MRYFKCVGYKTKEKFFTIGKVYEARDDTRGMTTDGGYTFDFFTVDDLSAWYDFVEVTSKRNLVPTIEIEVRGRKTIARLYDANGNFVRTRYCVCHEDDKYDFVTGAEIAMKRLFDKNYARSLKQRFAVGDKVEVFAPIYAEPYNVSFFTEENIKYFNKFLYGKTVEKNAFGTVVAKRGTTCLIDKATFEKGKHYIIVDERGLKKL